MRVDGHPPTLSVTPHLGTAQSSCAVTETSEVWPPSQSRRHLLETEWPGFWGVYSFAQATMEVTTD